MSASQIAAWWGAIIATLVLGWDVFKWKQTGRPRLRLTASPGMKPSGSVPNVDPNKTYIAIEVVNVGDRKTELTHVTGIYYRSRLQRLRGRNERAFFVVNPAFSTQFPCFLEPGQRWLGGLEQTADLEESSRAGLFYCGIIHSASKKPLTTRVVVPVKAT